MKLIFTLLLALLSQLVFSQKEDKFFVFDDDWKPTKIKKGVYFLRVRQKNDSGFEWIYYKMYGPRIKQETFKDLKSTVRNGKFAYYHSDGTVDSTGDYVNNQLNGIWIYRNHNTKTVRQKEYNMGIVIKDTVYHEIQPDPKQKIELKPGEKESEYPGGAAGWIQYLQKNLHYPDRAVSAEVMGEVRIQFIVDKEGNVITPEISKSVEYSLDEEALRMINESNKWEPAEQDGRHVKSYKIQPIKFMLTKG